jgi:hypothetical protein
MGRRGDARLPQRILDVDIADARGTRLVKEKGLDRAALPGQERSKGVQRQVHEVRAELADHGMLRRGGGVVSKTEPPVVGFTIAKTRLP